MKKLFKLLMLLVVALVSFVSCYDDSEIRERLEALEKYNIASISEQVAAIQKSIASLENVDKELKSSVTNLGNTDIALDKKIAELKSYAENELASMKDWTKASFATIEQYNSICDELAAIKVKADSLESGLAAAISTAESSMKGWVNEQLSEYCTLAEVQARMEELGSASDEDIKTLSSELAKTKTELIASYQKAISDAIANSKGQLSTEIEKVNRELSNRITAIETRVSVIEEKLNKLMKEFDITFDTDEIVMVKSGGTTTIGYTIKGATHNTVVRALTQNGWKAQVSSYSTSRGRINVESPVPLVEDEIVVIVSDGEYRTIMKTIKCVTAITSSSQSSVEMNADGGNIDVTVTTNQDYTISIPESAKDWISVVGTKATRTETITFALKKNEGRMRVARVYLVGKDGGGLMNFIFTQEGGVAIPGTIVETSVEVAGTLVEKLGNEYLNIESLKISGNLNGSDFYILKRMTVIGKLKHLDLQYTHIVEGGSYYEKIGESDKDILYTENNTIGKYMFASIGDKYNNDRCNLESIILPESLEKIDSHAFENCYDLNKVSMFAKISSIGTGAFTYCNLSSVEIPDSVTDFGKSIFDHNENLISVKLPNNIKTIPNGMFSSCYLLQLLKIPETVTIIAENAFFNCNSLTEVEIPKYVTSIGENAFKYCSNLTKVKLPDCLKEIQSSAFWGCSISEIIIPKNVQQIERCAFGDEYPLSAANNIMSVRLESPNILNVGINLFNKITYKAATLYIPKNSLSNYVYTDFGNFINIVEY